MKHKIEFHKKQGEKEATKDSLLTGGVIRSLILLLLFSFSIVSAETFGYGKTEEIPINYSLIPTVNNSQYFDGYSVSSLWNYYSNLGNSIWCKLTGCTMNGDITFNNAGINNASILGLNTSYIPTGLEAIGSIYWDSAEGTTSTRLSNDVILQNGRELYFYGKANGNIFNGNVCEYAGSQGDHILIKKGNETTIASTPFVFLGVATESFTNGNFGRCTWFGRINNVYTRHWNSSSSSWVQWNAGDILYWDNTNGSQLTNVPPYAPQTRIEVGYVIKTMTGSSENGAIEIAPEYNGKLQNLDDVDGIALTTNGQFYVWNDTRKVFDANYNINNYYLQSNPLGFINSSSMDSALLGNYWFFNTNLTTYGTVQGTLANTNNYDDYDSIAYNLTEAVPNGLLWYANTTNNVTTSVNKICIRYKAIGNSFDLGVYDTDGYWENYLILTESTMFSWACADIRDSPDHLLDNKILIKITNINSASTTHKLQIDALYVSSGYTPRIGNEVDPLSLHKDGSTQLTGNWNAGAYNITTTQTGFFGWLGNLTSRITKAWFINLDLNGTLEMNKGNITNVSYIKLDNVTGNCDLSINGTICKNSTGVYIVG